MPFDPRASQTTLGYGVNSLSILVHGATKVGKTRLAATTGDPRRTIILAAEPGLLSLRDQDIRVYEMDTIETLYGAIAWLEDLARKGKLKGVWVILDSASDIAERLLRTLKTTPGPNGKLMDPRHAYGEVMDGMTEVIKRLRALPCNTVCIAQQERVEKPDGTTSYGASLPGQKLSSKVGYNFEIVLAMHAARRGDEVVRWFQTVADGRFEAGDRSGVLDPMEPADLGHIAHKILATVATPPSPVTPEPSESAEAPATTTEAA